MKQIVAIILFCLTLLGVAPTYAAQNDFGHLPIMHEGRVKPLATFARIHLEELSGSDNLQGVSADNWLAEALFSPGRSINRPVFKIKHPDVLQALDIEAKKDGKFLFTIQEVSKKMDANIDVLASILQTPEEEWGVAQKRLIDIQRKLKEHNDVLTSLSLFMPIRADLPDGLRATYNLGAGELSAFDVMPHQEQWRKNILSLTEDRGADLERYTHNEQQLVLFSYALGRLKNAGAQNEYFRVVPLHGEWLSPWQALLQAEEDTSEILSLWQQAVQSYREEDQVSWQAAVREIRTAAHDSAKITPRQMELEEWYHALKPFELSLALYILTASLLMFVFIRPKPTLNRAAFWLASGALFIHTLGLAARVIVLDRPPVSTLYESILFVGLIAVLWSLIAELRRKDGFGLHLAVGSGILMQVLGLSHAQDPETLLPLTAVLNTNFWLATHVLCITAAYAFCLLTALVAHYGLWRYVQDGKLPADVKTNQHTLALISLFLATIGTVLGGIWADQSWGRFWGWDPKENGALLIVLWLIWVLHGRISAQLGPLAVTAALAFLSMIVALSWFGVNLLSVGLHSYGFTDTMAVPLIALLIFEIAVIVWVFVKYKRAA